MLKFLKKPKENNQINEGNSWIRIYLGKTGSGKTMLQTHEFVIPALLNNEEVYSCYWINWNKPNWHYFAPKNLDKIINLRNSMIVFDEIRRSLDPRNWESEDEQIRSFFELHRHRHNDIIGNTQDISLVAKTIGVQAHEWALVEQIDRGFILKIIDKLRKRQGLTFQKDYLSYQELKKMAAGWELGEEIGIDNDWEIIHMPLKDIIRHDLDEFKQELVHKYCPKCKSRQGKQILKEETNEIIKINNNGIMELKEEELCPKCKITKLEIRESGMFDTDYEPETTEKKVIFKAYSKQEVWREYKGILSDKQIEFRNKLDAKVNRV